MKQRLRALEKLSAEQGIVLTEAQVQALERKKHDDEACGVRFFQPTSLVLVAEFPHIPTAATS